MMHHMEGGIGKNQADFGHEMADHKQAKHACPCTDGNVLGTSWRRRAFVLRVILSEVAPGVMHEGVPIRVDVPSSSITPRHGVVAWRRTAGQCAGSPPREAIVSNGLTGISSQLSIA